MCKRAKNIRDNPSRRDRTNLSAEEGAGCGTVVCWCDGSPAFEVAHDKWVSAFGIDEHHRSTHERRVLCQTLRRLLEAEFLNTPDSSCAVARSATLQAFVGAELGRETTIEKEKRKVRPKMSEAKPGRVQKGAEGLHDAQWLGRGGEVCWRCRLSSVGRSRAPTLRSTEKLRKTPSRPILRAEFLCHQGRVLLCLCWTVLLITMVVVVRQLDGVVRAR